MFKKIGYTALGFLMLSGVAFGGLWNFTFPIIGGASYCGSTVNKFAYQPFRLVLLL
jgi:hypothetical protein